MLFGRTWYTGEIRYDGNDYEFLKIILIKNVKPGKF
jgi:hypothetical protein